MRYKKVKPKRQERGWEKKGLGAGLVEGTSGKDRKGIWIEETIETLYVIADG